MDRRNSPLRVATISALLIFTAILTGCTTGATADTGNEREADCASLVVVPPHSTAIEDTQRTHYSIYIEVTDTSSRGVSDILSQIEPFISCAVRGGSFLRIVLDAGEGTEARVLEGFDGAEAITAVRDLNRKNNRGEAKARDEDLRVISHEVSDALKSAAPAPTGSATRLLSLAATDAAGLGPDDRDVVVLWSPLLGTSTSGTDCLAVTGIEATDANAAAIVDRCIDQGLLQPITASGVKLVGVAYGATAADQQRFASEIQAHLYSSIFAVSQEG